jgi:hypothetical protein
MLVFQKTVPPPSSGCLYLVYVDIEVIGRKTYVDCVGRWQGVWPIRAVAEEGNMCSTEHGAAAYSRGSQTFSLVHH